MCAWQLGCSTLVVGMFFSVLEELYYEIVVDKTGHIFYVLTVFGFSDKTAGMKVTNPSDEGPQLSTTFRALKKILF